MLLSSGEITPPCGTPCLPLALSMIFSRCMTWHRSRAGLLSPTADRAGHCRSSCASRCLSRVSFAERSLSPHGLPLHGLSVVDGISERPRLEVRLEDWLQYQLERALHHSIADSRNRKDADLAPILRNFLPPRRQRHIATPDQFVRNLPEKRLFALRFDGLEGHPVTSRSPIVLFGQPIRLA